MFVGRGIKQDKPVITSSLIFIVNKNMPTPNHIVTIINHTIQDQECFHLQSMARKGFNPMSAIGYDVG